MGAISGTGEAKLSGVPLYISALHPLLSFPPHQLVLERFAQFTHPPSLYAIDFLNSFIFHLFRRCNAG